MNDVNGAYVAGTEVMPDQPSAARKTKTATRVTRIVSAAIRTTAAKMRSPRRLGRGEWMASARSGDSGEAVAVTVAPLDYGTDDGGYDDSTRTVVPAVPRSAAGRDLGDDRGGLVGQGLVERRRARGLGRGLLAGGGHHV